MPEGKISRLHEYRGWDAILYPAPSLASFHKETWSMNGFKSFLMFLLGVLATLFTILIINILSI